ncbi:MULTISPECIES: hypothetical protein [unclassified Saccharothrix]|uniref:hypothetical protein n=1 Tax=unclassified Saccharothrix TaxID=2593673 RepID=UPI00307D10BD
MTEEVPALVFPSILGGLPAGEALFTLFKIFERNASLSSRTRFALSKTKEALAARQAPGEGRASILSPSDLPEATTFRPFPQPVKRGCRNGRNVVGLRPGRTGKESRPFPWSLAASARAFGAKRPLDEKHVAGEMHAACGKRPA